MQRTRIKESALSFNSSWIGAFNYHPESENKLPVAETARKMTALFLENEITWASGTVPAWQVLISSITDTINDSSYFMDFPAARFIDANSRVLISLAERLYSNALNVEAVNNIAAWQYENTIEAKVVKDFESIPEVRSIVTENRLAEKTFSIFIYSVSYNDELMDRLLAKEFEILKEFSEHVISFNYKPFASADALGKHLSNAQRELLRR